MQMRLFSTHAHIQEIKGSDLQKQIESIVAELSSHFDLSSCHRIKSVLDDVRNHIPPTLAGWVSQNYNKNLIGTSKVITNIMFDEAILRLYIVAKSIRQDKLADAIEFIIKVMGVKNHLSENIISYTDGKNELQNNTIANTKLEREQHDRALKRNAAALESFEAWNNELLGEVKEKYSFTN